MAARICDYKTFVKAWQRAKSFPHLLEQLGTHGITTSNQAKRIACYLRRKGVSLKHMPPTRGGTDYDKLNQLAQATK